MLQTYTALWHKDATFFQFCYILPLVSMISFFTMAIPMSLLALWNPSFIHKYYVQKKRPSASQIGSMMVYGIFYSLLNHFCMILLFVVAFPLYGSYLPRVIQFATPWNVQHLLQALVQLVAVIYMEDSMYYYAHRMCHTNKMLFKYVHQLHHTIYTPIALTGHYMSVTEFVLIGSTVVIAPMLIGFVYPIAWGTFLAWIVWRQWEASEGHCGMHLPINIIDKIMPRYDGPAFHDFHHSKVLGNYGGFSSFNDARNDTFSSGFLQYMNKM